jgi:hypothetical protein
MPAAGPQPHQCLVDGLIAADPEVESQLLATSHSHVLAASSAADARTASEARRAARRRCETLRNVHDPRRRRHVHVALGFAGCVLAGAALIVLNRFELHAILAGSLAAAVVLAAAGVWLGGAWCVALARRDDRRRTVVALAAAAVLLDALLAALYALGAADTWLTDLPGMVVALLITGVAVVASTLMEFTEPAFVASARWQWRRAEARYRRAAVVAGEDAQSAAAAMTAWLTLIRARLAAAIGGDDCLMRECLAYAASIGTAGAEARG